MKIGVISDTHDQVDNIDKAFELLAEHEVKMVVHCGDWVAPYTLEYISQKAESLGVPLKGVLGNNDGEVFMIVQRNPKEFGIELGKETLDVDVKGRKIVVYHGTDEALTEGLLKSDTYDAVFSGHTHVQRNEVVEETLALNPGTLSGYSKLRDGKIDVGELAVYDSETNTAELLTFSL